MQYKHKRNIKTFWLFLETIFLPFFLTVLVFFFAFILLVKSGFQLNDEPSSIFITGVIAGLAILAFAELLFMGFRYLIKRCIKKPKR